MPSRARLHLLFVLLGIAALVAACSGGSQRGREPATTTRSESETLYEQYRRVTALTCSPRRRHDALGYGTGPLCARFDSIPAIDHPRFARADRVSLPAAEPVVALDLRLAHRAYPVRFLIFHEVVNDTVAGRPIVVSFCPLCNSAVAHSRRVAGRTLTFGVSGQLASANLIMFDRQTLTTWHQITGVARVGPLSGKKLAQLPVTLVSFGSWRAAHQSGQVMRAPRGYGFSYGKDPYANYDVSASEQSPVLSPSALEKAQPTDPRLPPKWRVVGVASERGSVAFPVPAGTGRAAVQTAQLGPIPLVVFFSHGAAQADKRERLAGAPRGWSGTVWLSKLDGRVLRFAVQGAGFVEKTTGSRFNLFGRAVSGPLAGARLTPAPQQTAFWFAWSHFHPRTAIAPRPGSR